MAWLPEGQKTAANTGHQVTPPSGLQLEEALVPGASLGPERRGEGRGWLHFCEEVQSTVLAIVYTVATLLSKS